MKNELPYWLALAHLPKIKTRKKNEIIVRLFEKGKTIIDFFNEQPSVWNNEYGIVEFEIDLFKQACKELSNYAFMVEDLLEQGYYIIPITSKEYSPTLKKNLGRTHAPPVLYAKGNLQILKEQSVAIVGSRKADDISLKFTDNVAKNASLSYKVVVSGFAKGVDKQALDSALKYNGQSIITLPQGITTFKSGFKKYYKKIVGGNLLVLSTFFPKAPWSVQLAMARNPIIYGLASEIYVAESSQKGGTWSGVMDGLRKGRTIYVRNPNSNEKNANSILISKGAQAVDQDGNTIRDEIKKNRQHNELEILSNTVEKKIIELLKIGTFDSKKIVDKLRIDWSSREVTSFLKQQDNVEIINGKPLKFTHRDRSTASQMTLF
jgi:DNA processing protein